MSLPPWWSVAAAAFAFVLLVCAVLLLVLLVVARRRARAAEEERTRVAQSRAVLELSVADQAGRLRIIRELHDVAVHQVSTMIAQADGARYSGAQDPTAAVRAATAIAETGRATLADMRRVMSLVRETEADIAPQPRLKSTRELFRVMRDAGLQVQFDESGEPYELKPGAELAVYRILQEALSNSLKYGGEGTAVRVGFTWTEQGLQVKVDDDGLRNALLRRGLDPNEVTKQAEYTVEDDLRALTEEITGPGIIEMRERTELYGGVFQVMQTPGVGFSIQAVFPTLRHHNGVHGVDLGRR